jgi:hypothetical protein
MLPLRELNHPAPPYNNHGSSENALQHQKSSLDAATFMSEEVRKVKDRLTESCFMPEHSRLRKMQAGRLRPSEGNRDSSTDTPSLAPQQNQADRAEMLV